jgi:hypothetical protein
LVLLLLGGGGGYFAFNAFSGKGTPAAAATTTRPTAAPGTTAATIGSAPTTAPATSSAPTTTAAVPHTSTTRPKPTGPQIDYIHVLKAPNCSSGGSSTVRLEWHVSGGATGSEVDIDYPGMYSQYDGAYTADDLPFPCDGPSGGKASHKYIIVTHGGGTAATLTKTVTAQMP